MRQAGLAVAAAWMALVAATAAAAQEEYSFKMHHMLGANAPTYTELIAPWVRKVEENSQGRVKIEVYPAMSLGGRPLELEGQARDGVVDIVWAINSYTPGLFAKTEAFELPFVYDNDPAAANLAMRDMFESELRHEYAGLEVMLLYVHAGQAFNMREVPVRSPADFEGLRIRIPSRIGAWTVEALGASPVSMPVIDIPLALQEGAVDGVLVPWEIIPPLKLQNQTKYQIEGAGKTRFGTLVFQVSMNKDRWNSLPTDIRKAFKDASGRDRLVELGRATRRIEDEGLEVALSAGNSHVELTEEETSEILMALEQVVDRWIAEVGRKGIDGARIVERARELIRANSQAAAN